MDQWFEAFTDEETSVPNLAETTLPEDASKSVLWLQMDVESTQEAQPLREGQRRVVLGQLMPGLKKLFQERELALIVDKKESLATQILMTKKGLQTLVQLACFALQQVQETMLDFAGVKASPSLRHHNPPGERTRGPAPGGSRALATSDAKPASLARLGNVPTTAKRDELRKNGEFWIPRTHVRILHACPLLSPKHHHGRRITISSGRSPSLFGTDGSGLVRGQARRISDASDLG